MNYSENSKSKQSLIDEEIDSNNSADENNHVEANKENLD